MDRRPQSGRGRELGRCALDRATRSWLRRARGDQCVLPRFPPGFAVAVRTAGRARWRRPYGPGQVLESLVAANVSPAPWYGSSARLSTTEVALSLQRWFDRKQLRDRDTHGRLTAELFAFARRARPLDDYQAREIEYAREIDSLLPDDTPVVGLHRTVEKGGERLVQLLGSGFVIGTSGGPSLITAAHVVLNDD